MYLRQVRVQHLKLLRDVVLDLQQPDGAPRMWTVVIGQNGTGKSSLLQAIALASAGNLQVNTLASRAIGHLRDRRSDEPLHVEALFEFPDGARQPELHPTCPALLPSPLHLRSEVSLAAGETSLLASAAYVGVESTQDPLDKARSRNTPRWFVAGYGVARFLPDVGRAVMLDRPSIERLQPLFDQTTALTSTGFSSYFGEEGDKALRFHRVLKRALLSIESLLPDIQDLELRGHGGVKKPGDLLERSRFTQRIGQATLKIPGVALSHGYQSTIAWVADLIGHILLEAEYELEPEQMEGLVLIDEIDLYLHPTWQAALIPALRATFPQMQFIVTTHSPVVLSGVAPHEVVRLASWGANGDVVEVVHDPETGDLAPASELLEKGLRPDARMMTGSEILRESFGVGGSTPNPHGGELRRYAMLASDPFRSESEHQEMLRLRQLLAKQGLGELPRTAKRSRS